MNGHSILPPLVGLFMDAARTDRVKVTPRRRRATRPSPLVERCENSSALTGTAFSASSTFELVQGPER